MVTDYLGDKKSFLPRKGCGLDILDINDNLTLITIDSEWFIQNWDKHPGINDQCDIKTRDAFFEELRSLINKNQNKTILIAIHHPLLTNGPHGGYYAASKHLFPIKKIPLPILGSVINLLRKTTGASPADVQHPQYKLLINRIETMLQGRDNIILVSGHEHSFTIH